ncbi:MAG: methylenetetrahydrofolate reductase [Magnetococcus sp. WYHC-3]
MDVNVAGTCRISLELVPRDAGELMRELTEVRHRLPGVATINVPDLPRFTLRAWEGCAMARQAGFASAIPHVRAMDFAPDAPLPFLEPLRQAGLRELLVITGDPPPEGHPRYATTAVDLLARLRREAPELTLYAALDPYRWGFQDELEYLRRKKDAGAHGFFTQPFFDLRLMAIQAELLEGETIFWGISPVATDQSRRYWEKRNKAIFPRDFSPTDAWNHAFGRAALAQARAAGQHVYFMPILHEPVAYMRAVLDSQDS